MGLAWRESVTLWLLASVWCLLLLGGALAPGLGVDAARIAAYAACGALLVFARPRARERASPLAALLAAASGFTALPAWLACLWLLGTGLGLAAPARSAAASDACTWLANVVLAPLFEELLYRERLLPALRQRIGAPIALVASSALFAAPHLEPWSVLASFCVGLALGGVFLASRRIELCIGHHAGLNGAALVCGLPPARAAVAPLDALLAGGLLLALAWLWTRGLGAGPRVHARVGRTKSARLGRAHALHSARIWPRSPSDS